MFDYFIFCNIQIAEELITVELINFNLTVTFFSSKIFQIRLRMSVKTLEKLSLESIAKGMSLWCNSSIVDLNRFKYVLGPFDGLSE